MSSNKRRPAVAVYSLGGTIAATGTRESGAIARLSAADLVRAVPDLSETAQVRAVSFRQMPSAGLRTTDLLELAEALRTEVDLGAAGVVVSQGTDVMEESAFVLDLVWNREAPLVVTGAMRHPDLPGADGPANLLAAVDVAVSPAARGLGCVVVFSDQVHAAGQVQKTHTSSIATFRSRISGPIGWVSERQVRIAVHPLRHAPLLVPIGPPREQPQVALLRIGLGEAGKLVSAIAELGYQGLVVEATGGGHLPEWMAEPLEELARQLPVVLASRTGNGEVLRQTYGFPGSERDLLARGLIPAGILDGLKARLLLTMLLMSGLKGEELRERFQVLSLPSTT